MALTAAAILPTTPASITINSLHSVSYQPYANVTVAGCIGGLTADFMLHSLDTVKTRLQAPKHKRFNNILDAYKTILREEGVRRGLYAGLTPAMTGTIPAHAAYFFVYETVKRHLTGVDGSLGRVCPDWAAHIVGGSIGDIAASILYVPSEVVKVRMQSRAFGYPNMIQAVKHIIVNDGIGAFYRGYRATIVRDVPFSALQFALYEKLKKEANKRWVDLSPYPELAKELSVGAIAGGTAGALTTPLDVVKTKLQMQTKLRTTMAHNTLVLVPETSSILECLRNQKRLHGWGGLFHGLAPRVAWTGLQSAGMFLVYEQILIWMA